MLSDLLDLPVICFGYMFSSSMCSCSVVGLRLYCFVLSLKKPENVYINTLYVSFSVMYMATWFVCVVGLRRTCFVLKANRPMATQID